MILFFCLMTLVLYIEHGVQALSAISKEQYIQSSGKSSCFPQESRNESLSIRGKWVSWRQNFPNKKQDCELAQKSARSCMNGVQKKFAKPKYFETDACFLPDFNAKIFHEALGKRELYFVGDSVTMQQKVRLKCELENSAMIKGIRISHTKHLIANLDRISHIPRDSIALMNIGLHFNDKNSYLKFLEEFEGLCLKNRCTNATIIWQETAAQHFPGSKNGYFNQRGKCKSGCVKIKREIMQKLDFRNKMAEELMNQYGIPILHVWDLTQDAYDMHVQLNSNSGLCDCTHFCNNALGVFRAYNRVLQAWLVQNFMYS